MKPALLCFLGFFLGASLLAQEKPLGDVARESKARATTSSQKVLTNDDLGSKSGFVLMRDASYATIPPVRVSFLVPTSKDSPNWATLYVYPLGQQRNVVFLLGPYLKECEGDLDCAEANVLEQALPSRFGLRNVEKLFQTTTELEGQPARITNFSGTSIAGRQRGIVVLIEAPAQVVTASCIYSQASFDPADSLCQTVIGSIKVEIPEHYKRWGGNGEWER